MLKRTIKLLFAFAVMSATLLVCAVSSNAALVGDIDGTKGVSASDARLVLRASVGLETIAEDLQKIADTDENGKLTAADARAILRMSVELDPVQHYYVKDYSKKPTCTEGGSVKAVCTECDDTYERDVEPFGHSFPDPEILVEVTCTTDGLEKYTCDREGCTHTEERTVAAGHTPDIPAATCTRDQFCTRGNHIMAEKLGHSTTWGTCTNCKSFNTEKYSAEAATIKAKFNEATKEATTAYSYIQNSVGAASWLTNYAKSAKPYYEKAKAAYQAAYDACGDIPEFATIKAYLAKNIANTTGIISQIDYIATAGYVDSSNYFALVDPIDNLNYINGDSIIDTNKAVTKLIVW